MQTLRIFTLSKPGMTAVTCRPQQMERTKSEWSVNWKRTRQRAVLTATSCLSSDHTDHTDHTQTPPVTCRVNIMWLQRCTSHTVWHTRPEPALQMTSHIPPTHSNHIPACLVSCLMFKRLFIIIIVVVVINLNASYVALVLFLLFFFFFFN